MIRFHPDRVIELDELFKLVYFSHFFVAGQKIFIWSHFVERRENMVFLNLFEYRLVGQSTEILPLFGEVFFIGFFVLNRPKGNRKQVWPKLFCQLCVKYWRMMSICRNTYEKTDLTHSLGVWGSYILGKDGGPPRSGTFTLLFPKSK